MIDTTRIERFYERRTNDIKPGLDATRGLLKILGNPERGMHAIHVAGTNGKGSVSAILASILKEVGFKTGLYTSPHLVRLNERFSINGAYISDEDLDELLVAVENAAEEYEFQTGHSATFFECVTALALLWFKRSGVNIAVLETGMGGRLDATNVIAPLISVITRISVDHTQFLGDTLEAIAAEKSGIIKSGTPVVCGKMDSAALAVVMEYAGKCGARVINAESIVSVQRLAGDLTSQKLAIMTQSVSYGTIKMKMAASYQVENVATAVAAIEALGTALNVEFPPQTVAKGLANAEWRGRFQHIGSDPMTLVDGAHNFNGAAALVKALRDVGVKNGVRFVVGMCEDKDANGFFREIGSVARKVWTVPVNSPRTTSPKTLCAVAKRFDIEAEACENLREALVAACADARDNADTVVVCGSLFLVGEMLDMTEKAALHTH